MSYVPKYIVILLVLITLDYVLALQMEKANNLKRTLYLILSIGSNLTILFVFKYFNFFNDSLATVSSLLHWNYSPVLLSFALPLGLSFHVFQSLSYVIEVYKGKYNAERSYYTYALYVLFFPQLVAGPIERPQHLLPQLNAHHTFNHFNVRRGLEQMLWGFFKKIVIADQIAQVINPLYANLPTESPLLWIMAILFSYQLYCDFSGYSDIAIGAARMLGYELQINFNRPYSARSLSDFWRRWHISLSSWLRDYLYYPLALGWGKKTKAKLYMSLIVTFGLIGLWHGANWTFVVFGLLHGLYLAGELATEKMRRKIRSWLHIEEGNFLYGIFQTLIVFVFVTISFVFFRSESVTKAVWFIHHMMALPPATFSWHTTFEALTKITGNIIFAVIILCIIGMEYLQSKGDVCTYLSTKSRASRFAFYYLLTVTILLCGYFGGESFIYFKF